jgi:hypothetical protein
MHYVVYNFLRADDQTMMHQKPIAILTIHRGSINVVGLSATTDFHLGLPCAGTAVSRTAGVVLQYG